MQMFERVSRYRSTYKDWVKVMLGFALKRFPLQAHLVNGDRITLADGNHAFLLTTGFDLVFEEESNCLRFTWKGNVVRMSCAQHEYGDIYSVFFKDEYGFLEPKDRICVDIGAHVGDSSIYLAFRGASRVISIEPYPANCEVFSKNVVLNHLSDKIEIINAGLADHRGEILVDEKKTTNIGRDLNASASGREIPLVTLTELLDRFSVTEGILKMDCEGCEYQTLLSCPTNALLRFEQIQLEYHFGCESIVRKLKESGFYVTFTEPFSVRNNYHSQKHLSVGFVYARRI